MAEQVFHNLGVPGFSDTQTYKHREILSSTVGFTQRGVIMAAGQGVVLAGTILAQKTSDNKYYVYNNAANDGREVARGVLRDSVNTAYGDQQVNLVIAGILKSNMLSGLNADAITDLNARNDTVRNEFKF